MGVGPGNTRACPSGCCPSRWRSGVEVDVHDIGTGGGGGLPFLRLLRLDRGHSPGASVEDLISIGTIGLMKAISTFDSTKAARLSTYAGKCINNELLMLFRSRKKHSREISLYEPIGTDKEGNEISLLDVMEGPAVDVVEEYSTREDIRHVLDSMKSVLSSKEYEVICCRFGLFGQKEQTQREIARHLHISRSYVSRIEKNALQNCGRFFLKTVKHALRVLPL